MKIEGDYTFAAPRDVVWPMLLDPDILASIMPGCEKLEKVGENEFSGILKIKVGPVQGKFNGDIKLDNITAPESYHIQVDGKGGPGFVKGAGNLRLEEENGNTVMYYEGDAQVGGRLASVGQRLLDTSARAIIRQGLEGLDHQVQARVAPPAEPEEEETGEATAVTPPPPPTQMEFATGVARNLIEEYSAPEKRDAIISAVIVGVGSLLLINTIINWFANKVAKKVVKQLDK